MVKASGNVQGMHKLLMVACVACQVSDAAPPAPPLDAPEIAADAPPSVAPRCNLSTLVTTTEATVVVRLICEPGRLARLTIDAVTGDGGDNFGILWRVASCGETITQLFPFPEFRFPEHPSGSPTIRAWMADPVTRNLITCN